MSYERSSDPGEVPPVESDEEGVPAPPHLQTASLSPPHVDSDAEAEEVLTRYRLAFEDYHQHRLEGDSPDEALVRTLEEWREFKVLMAFVPHLRP